MIQQPTAKLLTNVCFRRYFDGIKRGSFSTKLNVFGNHNGFAGFNIACRIQRFCARHGVGSQRFCSRFRPAANPVSLTARFAGVRQLSCRHSLDSLPIVNNTEIVIAQAVNYRKTSCKRIVGTSFPVNRDSSWIIKISRHDSNAYRVIQRVKTIKLKKKRKRYLEKFKVKIHEYVTPSTS